jgi:hypothetical protein
LESCAVIWHLSPMALSRLVCAFGRQSLVTVLTRCGLPFWGRFLSQWCFYPLCRVARHAAPQALYG